MYPAVPIISVKHPLKKVYIIEDIYFSFISVNKTYTYKPTYIGKTYQSLQREKNYIAPNGQ